MSDSDAKLCELASTVGQLLQDKRWTVATAESCTGGLVAAALTEIPGSSAWFEQGIVSYSNSAKSELLGVEQQIIEEHGAVSEAVVLAMANGARERANADIAVAISGVAGPDGGSEEKPVGTVWVAWSHPAGSGSNAKRFNFGGDRRSVREAATVEALKGVVERVKSV